MSLSSWQSVWWKKWLAVAAAFFVVFPVIGFLVIYWVLLARDTNAPGGEALGFGTLALLGLLALGAVARMAWSKFRRLVVDEGGMRVRGVARDQYLPFEAIENVSVREGPLGTAMLDVLTRAGKTESFTLPPNSRETLDAILAKVGDKTSERATADLERLGDSLEAWQGRLDRLASSLKEEGYRNAAIDRAALAATLRSADAPAEVRAGAAYVLARTGCVEELHVLTDALDKQSPPIVVLMTALAARGRAAVAPGLLSDAARYWNEADAQYVQSRLNGAPACVRIASCQEQSDAAAAQEEAAEHEAIQADSTVEQSMRRSG